MDEEYYINWKLFMGNRKILLREENLISLRTAVVADDENIIHFSLSPRWLTMSLPETCRDYGKSDITWLYRRKRSSFREWRLRRGFFPVEQNIKPLVFARHPEFKLLWTDSGQSVALFLNGEPWAFIHEESNHGYSKGILKATMGNPWNQELFERTFT